MINNISKNNSRGRNRTRTYTSVSRYQFSRLGRYAITLYSSILPINSSHPNWMGQQNFGRGHTSIQLVEPVGFDPTTSGFSDQRSKPNELRFHCGKDKIRTCDTRLFRPMLYQLSYYSIISKYIKQKIRIFWTRMCLKNVYLIS